MAWQSLKAKKPKERPLVTIRTSGVAFNKSFAEKYDKNGAVVGNLLEVLVDSEEPDRIGFLFHAEDLSNGPMMYRVRNDKPGLVVGSSSLFKTTSMGLLSVDKLPMSFEPKEDRSGSRVIVYIELGAFF